MLDCCLPAYAGERQTHLLAYIHFAAQHAGWPAKTHAGWSWKNSTSTRLLGAYVRFCTYRYSRIFFSCWCAVEFVLYFLMDEQKQLKELLIEEVRKRPQLWNISLPDYRDRSLVMNTWESIGKSLNRSGNMFLMTKGANYQTLAYTRSWISPLNKYFAV